MVTTEKYDADQVTGYFYKAGDVIVVTKKRCGDPYMIMLKTPIFVCKREDGSRYTVFSRHHGIVSLYNHRVFYDDLEDPKDEPAETRDATDDEKNAYLTAMAKECIEDIFCNLANGTSDRWSKLGFEPQVNS